MQVLERLMESQTQLELLFFKPDPLVPHTHTHAWHCTNSAACAHVERRDGTAQLAGMRGAMGAWAKEPGQEDWARGYWG